MLQNIEFLGDFAKCKFFSFLIDGSTDAGNLEDKLVVLQYCVKDSTQGDADGLLNCLATTLNQIGIKDILDKRSVLEIQQLPVLVGGATDGASVIKRKVNNCITMVILVMVLFTQT